MLPELHPKWAMIIHGLDLISKAMPGFRLQDILYVQTENNNVWML